MNYELIYCRSGQKVEDRKLSGRKWVEKSTSVQKRKKITLLVKIKK